MATLHRRFVVSRTRVIAVVGSFGKTTTARAVVSALGTRGLRPFSNSGAKLALAVLRLRPWEPRAVFEVAIDGPGQMGGYASMVRPDVVVVTSIGSEHNRAIGGLENTRHEKVAMVRALRSNGCAVLNGDDPHVRWMASQTDDRVVTYGLNADNEIQAADVELDWPNGTRFTVHAGGQAWPVKSRLFGRHHVSTVLAAWQWRERRGV